MTTPSCLYIVVLVAKRTAFVKHVGFFSKPQLAFSARSRVQQPLVIDLFKMQKFVKAFAFVIGRELPALYIQDYSCQYPFSTRL